MKSSISTVLALIMASGRNKRAITKALAEVPRITHLLIKDMMIFSITIRSIILFDILEII